MTTKKVLCYCPWEQQQPSYSVPEEQGGAQGDASGHHRREDETEEIEKTNLYLILGFTSLLG